MTRLSDATDEELLAELNRRGAIRPECSCRHWGTYLDTYDQDGYTWRCHGCLRAIARCTCR